jgi:hypothetical protein
MQPDIDYSILCESNEELEYGSIGVVVLKASLPYSIIPLFQFLEI